MSALILRSGDLRPWVSDFFKYYFPSQVSVHPNTFTYNCQQNEDGSFTRVPQIDKVRDIIEEMRNFPDRIIITGVRVTSKVCKKDKKPDLHMHWFPILINPSVNKAFIYNPLMYHLDFPHNFSYGLVNSTFANRLKAAFLENGWKLEGVIATKARKTLVQRVRTWASGKIGASSSARIWFPLLIMAEMSLMIQNPAIQRKELLDSLRNMEDGAFDTIMTSLQDRVETYYASHVYKKRMGKKKHVCKTDKIVHGETNRCVNKDGTLGRKLQGILPSRICDANQTFNIDTRRCKKLSYKFMELQRVSADSEEKTFLDHAITQPALFKYLQSKYPHGAFFNQGGVNRISWLYVQNEKEGYLKVPKGFDTFWKKAMADPKYSQMVVFLDMDSTAHSVGHSNVLIYTKATKELEVFEPNGLQMSAKFGPKEMYSALREHFAKFDANTNLRTPIDYCPKKIHVFQSMEANEKGMWNTEGYCAVWSVWYTEHRLMNPEMTTAECVHVAMSRLLDLGSLREFIWNYDRWMRRQLQEKA